MDSFPQAFRELDEMRVKLSTSTDISNVQIQLLTRGADSQYVANTHNFQLNVQESNDTYEERTDTNELVGSQLTGQAARDAMFNAFKESTFFFRKCRNHKSRVYKFTIIFKCNINFNNLILIFIIFKCKPHKKKS